MRSGRRRASRRVVDHLGAGEVEPPDGDAGAEAGGRGDVEAEVEGQAERLDRGERRLRASRRLGAVGGVGEAIGDAAGHLLADPQVVALEEDEADDELQHHDRHQ